MWFPVEEFPAIFPATSGLQQFLKSSHLVPSGSDQVKPKAIDPRPLTIDGKVFGQRCSS